MRTNDHSWLVIVVAAAAVWWLSQRTPAPSPAPSGTLRAKVTSAVDAGRLSRFYATFADAIGRDAQVVKTTGTFRAAHRSALLLAFQGTDLAGKYGVGPAIDARIAAAVGSDDAPLDSVKRSQLTAALRAIAADFGS